MAYPQEAPCPPPSAEEILRQRIAQEGAVTLAEYMTVANTAYYATRDPLGAKGDFTTSPEISQIFGESLALALLSFWHQNSEPSDVTLAELGPGRGTLMADLLRTVTSLAPAFYQACRLALLETSPLLQAHQHRTLASYDGTWYTHVEALLASQQPLFLVANEFLDALALHQYQRTSSGWREQGVTLDAAGDFIWTTLETDFDPGAVEEDFIERAPLRTKVFLQIVDHVRLFGGCALFIDYGESPLRGNTLQAVRNHTHWSVLKDPGQADITSHVDFEALQEAARARAFPPPSGFDVTLESQRLFLKRHYSDLRSHQLLAQAAPSQKEALQRGYERLVHPDHMGTLFKVLCVSQKIPRAHHTTLHKT